MTRYIKSKPFDKIKNSRGIALVSILIILAVFGLSFIYLVQTNNLVKQSYQIREQKERLQKLESASRELQVEIALWQSPDNLERLIQNLELVKADQIVYLKEQPVALKR